MAARYSLQFADAFATFQKVQKDPVPLAFPYPTGSPAQPPAVTKVSMGEYLQAAETATAEKRAVERGVILETCRAAGAPNDAAKTQEIFKGAAQAPLNTFLAAMANTLYEQSQLYGRRKMDQPDKLKILSQRALDVLDKLPDSKEKKDLAAKVKANLKENKAL
jgi:hypothetical protein